MIAEYSRKDLFNILNVINDAALKYKGVIPDDCWHEPYMLEQELTDEFDSGVRMFGYARNNTLVGVMGIQELREVTLIRHAYTLADYQGIGIGTSLLQYLLKINESSCLYVGTWKNATWAIKFYDGSLIFIFKIIDFVFTIKLFIKKLNNTPSTKPMMIIMIYKF